MMERIALGLASIVLAVALVLGFQPPDDGLGALAIGSSGGPAGGSSGGSTAGTTAAPSPDSTSAAEQVVDGSIVRTRFGPVQVEITVSKGRIIDVKAVALPTGGRDDRLVWTSEAARHLTNFSGSGG
ncbi:MAG: hypothetical protein FIA92_07010 [Chloroflexi bacterium]|nr:hypothetical protein [Chloroflexota bacterium]